MPQVKLVNQAPGWILIDDKYSFVGVESVKAIKKLAKKLSKKEFDNWDWEKEMNGQYLLHPSHAIPVDRVACRVAYKPHSF